jgi:hypothetical protein
MELNSVQSGFPANLFWMFQVQNILEGSSIVLVCRVINLSMHHTVIGRAKGISSAQGH